LTSRPRRRASARVGVAQVERDAAAPPLGDEAGDAVVEDALLRDAGR